MSDSERKMTGSLTDDGKGRIYSYDSQNRMTGLTVTDGKNTNSWSYAYDDGGERIIKNTIASGNGGTLVSSTVYWFTGYEETYENVITVDGDILAENGQRLAARTSYLSSADGTTIQKTEVLGRSKIDGEGGVVRPGDAAIIRAPLVMYFAACLLEGKDFEKYTGEVPALRTCSHSEFKVFNFLRKLSSEAYYYICKTDEILKTI